jgi:hypothetical protein
MIRLFALFLTLDTLNPGKRAIMKNTLLIIAFIFTQTAVSQIPTSLGFALSDEFSEHNSIVKTQGFLLNEILKSPDNVVQFELDRIASSMSGDLTSFFYRCVGKQTEGLILSFFGDYWNDSGDIYKGFVFKNLPGNEALEFISQISRTMEEQKEFLSKDNDNSVSLQYDDLTVVISKDIEFKIRLFWIGFDADWDHWAYSRTKRTVEEDLQ